MKTVIINASHRKNGATAKVLNEFAYQLECEGMNISLFHLSDLKLDFCKGCCNCYKTGRCFLADDADMLSQAISEADGLVIGTPCYVSDVSGQLKTFIDRGHFVFEQWLKGKHTVGVVTYENYGGSLAYKTLKNLFVFSGAKTVGRLIVKTAFGSDPTKNSKLMNQIKKKAVKLRSSMQSKRTSLLSGITHFFVLNFGIKPFVLKKGNAYQGVLKHWEERGIPHRAI